MIDPHGASLDAVRLVSAFGGAVAKTDDAVARGDVLAVVLYRQSEKAMRRELLEYIAQLERRAASVVVCVSPHRYSTN